MYTHIRNSELMRAAAGVILAVFAAVTLFSNLGASLAHAGGLNSGLTAIAEASDPSKTTLGVGDSLLVKLNYQASPHDIKVDPAGSCTVNGKAVGSTFQDFGDGTYQMVYTVAAGDTDRTAGTIPFSCAFIEVEAGTNNATGNSGTVSAFTSANSLAISTGSTGGGDTGGGNTGGGDTGGGNTGGGTNTVGNATVSASPNSGTLGVGDTLTVNIHQLDGMTDLTMADTFCKINNVETTNFTNLGGGNYQVTHTYTAQDADIPAGQLTFTCNVKNSAGQTATLHFTESNTVAIDTQPDDNGLPPAGTFQVSVEPNTGTVTPGGTVLVHINDSGGVTDFAVDPAGSCTVNGKDVKSTFQAFGDHTYQVTYIVAEGDQNVAAGQLAMSCAVKNPSGVTGTINTISTNSLAISGTASGGNTGGNTGGNGSNSSTGGNINGDVQGGNSAQDNGTLAVTQIEQVKSVATADGTFENGWKWIFRVTVPTNETKLQLKFTNWTHSNTTTTISPANNMRISTTQANNGGATTTITAADTYTTAMTVDGDLDTNTPGRQILVTVEMAVPTGSTNGTYTTTYSIKSATP
jgi:methionine-rich copper-binding protein CopC